MFSYACFLKINEILKRIATRIVNHLVTYFKIFLFYIRVKLINNVVLVSVIHLYIYKYLFFFKLDPTKIITEY